MKKLLAVLGAISLVGTSAVSVTACSSKKEDGTIENIKRELEQYVEMPFFASSSNVTSEQLATELSSRLTLGNYKLIVKNDTTFVSQKIVDNNIEQTNTLAIAQQQNTEGNLTVVNGSANVNILKKDKEVFNIQIQWVTNELLLLTSTVNKVNHASTEIQNINLPLPQIMPRFNLTFADLYSYIDLLSLPEDEIQNIDLAKITESDFLDKFDNVLDILAANIKNDVGFDISDYLNKDISFKKAVIIGKGTVKDLLHNVAPDLVALLQWFISEGKAQIKATHNTLLPLVQYLLSPINDKLKENIKVSFGEDYFYQEAKTNLDSLVFHLLTGYRTDYKKTDSKYRLSVDIYILFLAFPINQSKIKSYLALKPTLLVGSILDIFTQNGDQGIGAVNTNFIQQDTWKRISSIIIVVFLPEIEVFLGPSLMSFAGPNILHDLGVSNTELRSNDVTMSAGTVKLQFKNKNGQWGSFTPIIDKNNNKINLEQILNAVDFKFSFTDVKFKVTAKNNDKISYETNGKTRFDLWLSDIYE